MYVPGARAAFLAYQAAMPSFRRPPRPPDLSRYENSAPIYCTRFVLNAAGLSLPGDSREWLVVDADDQIRVAPTDHFPDLTDEQRRRMSSCGGYYPPPAEGEADRG